MSQDALSVLADEALADDASGQTAEIDVAALHGGAERRRSRYGAAA